MKLRNALSIGLLFVFAGCGAKTVLTYSVRVDTSDTTKIAELFEATERVMTRRLAGADVKNGQTSVVPKGGTNGTLTFTLPNAAAASTAKRIIEDPFTFDIRIEKLPEGTAAPDPMKGSEWIQTALTGSSLSWVEALEDEKNHQVAVELQFNAHGRDVLGSAFKGNKGKHIGIFVRDLLVSKLKIDSETVNEHVIISGIPSARVAQIFADDVNVGLHVSYSPSR